MPRSVLSYWIRSRPDATFSMEAVSLISNGWNTSHEEFVASHVGYYTNRCDQSIKTGVF